MGFYDELKKTQKDIADKDKENAARMITDEEVTNLGDEYYTRILRDLESSVKHNNFRSEKKGFLRGKEYFYYSELHQILYINSTHNKCFEIHNLSDVTCNRIENAKKVFAYVVEKLNADGHLSVDYSCVQNPMEYSDNRYEITLSVKLPCSEDGTLP